MKTKAFNYQMSYPVLSQPVSDEDRALSRDEMILKYTPFIKYVAHRLAIRLPSHIHVEDLMSAGVIGLMDALSKFDPDKKVGFKTYAEFRIRGAMLDELRALDWVPRSVRQKATQIEKVISQLEKRKGMPVEEEEIASEMGLTLEAYFELTKDIHGISLLDEEILQKNIGKLPEEDLIHFILDDEENDPFHLLSLKELKRVLARATEELSHREKIVLSLYYYEELTLREIGEALDLTESRICQIHSKSILKLRAKLKRYLKDDL